MDDKAPSLQQLNRTFIGSVLFIDIVGYSRGTVPEQIAMKEVFNRLLIEAVQNVAPGDRIMVDTGDGAGVAFLGDPEDALFAALSLRDAIDAGKVEMGEPGFVRMGINLGPLKMVRDINGHTNMIGDAVNDAQRVMSFANPGQVMVSYSYYDIISRFSLDYAKLFTFEGSRHDKHVREHQVYSFGPNAGTEVLTEKLRNRSRARNPNSIMQTSFDAPPAMDAAAAASEAAAVDAAVDAVTKHAGPGSPASGKAVPKKKGLPIRVGMIASIIFCAVGIVSAAGAWYLHANTAQVTARNIAPPTLAQIAASGPVANPASTPGSASAPTVDIGTVPLAAATGAASAKAADVNAKPGTVSLSIAPWGEIFVDGVDSGVSPPLKSLTLAPGKHKIEIRNGDFAPFRKTIVVKSDADVAVHYVF